VLISRLNNRGFSLLEVLVAMIIMLVGLLGLLQAIIVASESNAKNIIRDEGVQMSDSWMNWLKAKPFDVYSATYTPKSVKGRVRGGNVNYVVTMTTEALGDNSRRLSVDVEWKYKNAASHTQVISIKSRQL